jgi:hypothetical protein
MKQISILFVVALMTLECSVGRSATRLATDELFGIFKVESGTCSSESKPFSFEVFGRTAPVTGKFVPTALISAAAITRANAVTVEVHTAPVPALRISLMQTVVDTIKPFADGNALLLIVVDRKPIAVISAKELCEIVASNDKLIVIFPKETSPVKLKALAKRLNQSVGSRR